MSGFDFQGFRKAEGTQIAGLSQDDVFIRFEWTTRKPNRLGGGGRYDMVPGVLKVIRMDSEQGSGPRPTTHKLICENVATGKVETHTYEWGDQLALRLSDKEEN
jgi:hypothetical protein